MAQINNFRKASVDTREELDARIEAVEKDLLKLLDDGGVARVAAETKWRMRAAELIRNTVVDTFSMTDPTPIFTERRDARLGDTLEFEQLINTLRVVSYSPQSHPLTFTPRKAKYTITTAKYELAYGIPLEKIMTRQHKLGEFVSMAGEAITRHYVDLSLTAIDTACASGNTDIRGRALRTLAAGADVTKDEVDAALRRMYTANDNITIFGSRWALDPILDHAVTLAGAGGPTAEEMRSRGWVNTYKGANLVVIEDDYNEYYTQWTTINGVDWDKLIFIAGGVGAALYERDLSALQWEVLDPKTAQWESGVRMDHGIFVYAPERYHVIQLA